MDLKIQKAILHIVDPEGSVPIISQSQLDIGDVDIFDFISKHTVKMLEDTGIKNAAFLDDQMKEKVAGIANENFIDKSSEIATLLYDIMYKHIAIAKGDILITLLMIDEVPHLGILKLNYRTGFTHFVNNGEGGVCVQLIRHRTILPAEGQRVDEGAFINLNDFSLKLLEKKYEVDGENRNYFSDLFLNCTTEKSKKEVVKILSSVAGKVAQSVGCDTFETSSKFKETIHKLVEKSDIVDIDELAAEVFENNASFKATYVEKLQEKGIAPQVQIDETSAQKLITKHKIRTDKGIEVNLPLSLYNDKDTIEFINNPNGTISILIKNISEITNR